VLAFLCAVIILCAEPGGAAQNRTKLVIGYSAMQASVAPLWVAQEQGFFSKYGIDPELIFVRTTSVQIAGLLSGHMDLSYGGGSGIFTGWVLPRKPSTQLRVNRRDILSPM